MSNSLPSPEPGMRELFDEWREHVVAEAGHFVGDGIVCEDGWLSATPKVLFILKEPNGYEGDHGPLNERLRRAATNSSSKLWNRPTFHNLGRWAYGLANHAGDVPAFEEADRAYRAAVLGCAYINIKKSSGGAVATKAVEAHAATYGHFVRRQVDIIAPDIVVCGGTWRMLKDHVFPDMTRVSYRVHALGSRLFINAFHPGCRTSHRKVYDQVLSSYHGYQTNSLSRAPV